MKRSLTREERIGSASDFKRIFASAASHSCRGAKIFFTQNEKGYNRIGITLRRKYGNAVERNYARRIMKEIYRNNKDAIKQGFDIILIMYPGKYSFGDREEQFMLLLGRSGLVKGN
ncbi:MAG: ribonuclease P protein component [Spirochaetales bacterium]|nr:ribonuclease P protein component [Spirochaetales bacterium]